MKAKLFCRVCQTIFRESQLEAGDTCNKSPDSPDGKPCNGVLESMDKVVTEAIEVMAETGLTPRELETQRSKLLAACVSALQRMMNAKTDDSQEDQRKMFTANLLDLSGAVGQCVFPESGDDGSGEGAGAQ